MVMERKKEKEYEEQVMDLKTFLIPSYPLKSIEIQKYYQNERRFDGVYSRDNLAKKLKDGAYVINLDEYADVGIYWIVLYALNNDIIYFDSFEVDHIPKRLKNILEIKT